MLAGRKLLQVNQSNQANGSRNVNQTNQANGSQNVKQSNQANGSRNVNQSNQANGSGTRCTAPAASSQKTYQLRCSVSRVQLRLRLVAGLC